MKGHNPTTSALADTARFAIVDRIEHAQVLTFVRRHLFRTGWITLAYLLVNVAALAIIALVWRQSGLGFFDAFPTVCLGMALGYVAFLAIHENLHALAYRSVGVTSVLVQYDFRRLTALCVARGAVLNGRQFAIVCAAPFFAINPALAICLFLTPAGTAALLVAGALLLHIGACSGDIALLNYLWLHRDSPMFTYDDAEQPITAFYKQL